MSAPQLHIALAVAAAASRRAGPPPAENIRILSQARDGGWDIRAICDQVADARDGGAVAESTIRTYGSHLLQIGRTCDLLTSCGLPASLERIRRVTSVVNDPSTLRGWLAAWRLMHICARMPWAGDHDPYLVAIRTGLHKRLGPLPIKRRCRKQLLRKVVRLAALGQQWEMGALAVSAYMFGLRVPSELIKQATASLFNVSNPGRSVYGPIRRKGALGLRTLARWCVCHADILLCPHDWLEILIQLRPSGLLFRTPLHKLMRQFQDFAVACGETAVHEFTSHCFRRGAGIDVLEAHGLKAMLTFGQWSSPQAAMPYASADEQTARALGTALADLSEED